MKMLLTTEAYSMKMLLTTEAYSMKMLLTTEAYSNSFKRSCADIQWTMQSHASSHFCI